MTTLDPESTGSPDRGDTLREGRIAPSHHKIDRATADRWQGQPTNRGDRHAKHEIKSGSPSTAACATVFVRLDRLFGKSRFMLDIVCCWHESARLSLRTMAMLVLLAGALLYQVAPARAACTDPPRAGVDWTRCDKRHLHLKGEDLSAAILPNADLSRSDFLNANLMKALLLGANLSRARFDKANLFEADLSNAHAYLATFVEGNLQRASLTDGDFQEADFERANLQEANLAEANLQEATLRQANLRQAVLQRSNLLRADLREADLVGADIEGANLYRAHVEATDLSEIRGMSQAQINEACGDPATKLPEGIMLPIQWACPVSD